MDKLLTLKQIQDETVWVVKFCSRPRIACKYSEINHDDDDIRDIDIASKQPAHLQPFIDAYYKYTVDVKFLTIPEYYNTVWAEQHAEASACSNCKLKDCNYNGERCSILS